MGTTLDVSTQVLYQLIINKYEPLEAAFYEAGYGYPTNEWMAIARVFREDINTVSVALKSYIATELAKQGNVQWWMVKGIADQMGLYINQDVKQVQTLFDGWKVKIEQRLSDLETGKGDTEGITKSQLYNIMSVDYSLYTGTIVDIFQQINALNDKIDNIDLDIGDDVMDKINAALAKAEEFLETLGNITATIWIAVEDQVTARAQEVFDKKIQPYESRIHDLEVDMKGYTSIFYDAILQLISFILLGLKIPQPRIEDAIADIEEWIAREVTTQTAEMKKEIDFLLSIIKFEQQWWIDGLIELLSFTGNGNGGLSIADVQAIVNQYIAPLQSQINSVMAAVSGIQIPSESLIKQWIAENPSSVRIADYIGDIDVLLAKQIMDKAVLPEDRISTVASYIIAQNAMSTVALEQAIEPITAFLTTDMQTSLTDIVNAFGTPEALVSYLINAPAGQEEPMLDLMQVLITMTMERGLA